MKLNITEDKSKIVLKESTREEYHQLKLHLTRKVDNYFFKKRHKMGLWDGSIDHFKNGIMRYGLWKEIYKCCKDHGYKFEIDKSQFPFDLDIKKEDIVNFCTEYFKDYRVKPTENNPEGYFIPYEHQTDAVFNMLKYKFGIVEVATAGGKSLIFAVFMFYILKYINPDYKFLLIVPQMSLVTQFYDDIIDYNLGYNKEQKEPFDLRVEEIFSDKPRKVRDGIKPNVFIGTYQSLINYPKEFFEQFDVVVCDESHTAKSKSLDTILSKTFGFAKYRIGLSGTYPNNDSAEYLTIQSLMGPKLITVKAKELMDKGLVSKVKINSIILDHNENEFAENVFMIKKRGDGKRAYLLEKEFVQKSLRRKLFFKKLCDRFNNNSLILFHNIEYGKMLYEYLRDNCINKHLYYVDGTTIKEKRETIKKLMEITEDKPKILVASFGTFSTGINIKSIFNIVFADSFKSDKLIRQSIGRGLRLHKEKSKLVVFDITDKLSKKYNNILYNQYISRRDKIYQKQGFPVNEMKVKL
ncbi:DEAD/DEAH box helicase family protein [Trichloromonas sp.]|uniref:DEAD/DEAH box helicase family protein n=1 Tax=Trichloromonas sp. TaxID=3069249 RepID=UPI002A42493C|nr:DEAD/DEAH box helicase family protein [Trichloromonas sp.]